MEIPPGGLPCRARYARASPGKSGGLPIFDRHHPRHVAEDAARGCVELLALKDRLERDPELAPHTINQYAREGRLPSLWIGKHRRFNRPDVERTVARAAGGGRRI